MAEKIIDTDIPRDPTCLYFVKGDPLTVWKAKMQRGGRKKKKDDKA